MRQSLNLLHTEQKTLKFQFLRRTAISYLVLAILSCIYVSISGYNGIEDYYLFTQDAFLLLGASLGLTFLSSRPWLADTPVKRWHRGHIAALIIVAASIAYIGSWLVMERYAQSRDEDLADLASRYMQHGWLGQPIPVDVQPFASAALPLWSGRWVSSGYWVSAYLPVNAGIRAVAGMAGDSWLAGPVLLMIGLVSIWYSARRIWPDQQDAAVVALVLAATSTQLVVNAMTPFATTAHFALNALWLACFLRGGRIGHTLAIAIGFLSTGIHQAHFYPLFLSGFVIWMWRSDRKHLSVLYAVSALIGYVAWDFGYRHVLLTTIFGPGLNDYKNIQAMPLSTTLLAKIGQLLTLEPFNNISRFVAWQNILLVPLAFIGAMNMISCKKESLPISFAFTLSCAIGLILTPWQGFGYGYRYFQHLMPCFLLLAAAGAMRLRDMGSPLPQAVVVASAAIAVIVTGPIAAWRSHTLVDSYAATYRMAKQAPADVVLINPLGGAYLQDIVRVDDNNRRPLLLDLGELSNKQLVEICKSNSVMLISQQHAIKSGVLQGRGDHDKIQNIADKINYMNNLGCARPVPIS